MTAQDLEAVRARIRDSFSRQQLMTVMQATVEKVEPGEVHVAMPFVGAVTQQHGFLHAGTVTALADNACGYAALSTMPLDAAVLSIEFKVNMLAPAVGERFLAVGRVIRSGKNIVVTAADVFASQEGRSKQVATMLATMMRVEPRNGYAG